MKDCTITNIVDFVSKILMEVLFYAKLCKCVHHSLFVLPIFVYIPLVLTNVCTSRLHIVTLWITNVSHRWLFFSFRLVCEIELFSILEVEKWWFSNLWDCLWRANIHNFLLVIFISLIIFLLQKRKKGWEEHVYMKFIVHVIDAKCLEGVHVCTMLVVHSVSMGWTLTST